LTAIAQNPAIGQSRDDLPPTHSAYLVGSHIIVYRVIGDSIGIVRILHQRMSVAKHI
jgi:plasmid stabilization system protein ParE